MKIHFLFLLTFLLPSCAVMDMLIEPDTMEQRIDRFKAATDHELFKIYIKEDKLGYIFDNGDPIKKVWGGKKVVSQTGQTIKLVYTRESFDKLKLFLGDDLSVGPGLENVHHVYVYLEDITKYELVDIQPMIEYMGDQHRELLKKKFVVSMIKVSKFSVEAYQKVMGDFGAEYRPYPMVKIKGSTGVSSKKGEEQAAYNIFVGYKLYDGSDWIDNFDALPKVDLKIEQPPADTTIDRVRARVKGRITGYATLPDTYKNKIWLYLMSRDEYRDDWLLQTRATINVNGEFEGVIKLGTLEEGNGHRYTIAAFITYFKINREVNSVIPILPFNKGKDIIRVKRKDNF